MLDLFLRCLAAKNRYIHSESEGGDYYIEVDGDTLYILFEWSDGSEDWISNLDFLPSERGAIRMLASVIKSNIQPAGAPYKNMPSAWRVHRGFLRVWKDMRDEIEEEVDRRLRDSPGIQNIVIVGYSHGGAMALLAYEDMKYIYGDEYNIQGFGFAAPRVVFGRVPPEVQSRIDGFITVRNGNDIVTRLPPKIFGYRDAGEVIEIGRKHIYTPIGAHYPFAYAVELANEERAELKSGASVWRLDRKKSSPD